jgi:hypothetical protein
MRIPPSSFPLFAGHHKDKDHPRVVRSDAERRFDALFNEPGANDTTKPAAYKSTFAEGGLGGRVRSRSQRTERKD